jgi:nicotinate-nucleotide--dimethylbenzimidazole phosphoribosyltransferase
MQPTERLEAALKRIEAVNLSWIRRAKHRQLQLTKPPGSLGRLEEIANRCVGIEQTLSPSVDRPTILLFASDHGVCVEGVSPYPQVVTTQMVVNFLKGGAAINALAQVNGITLQVVDIGLIGEMPEMTGLTRRRVAAATRNFCQEAAMSQREAVEAINVGLERVQLATGQGCFLLGIGEMGIGNTTAASALTAAITGLPARAVVGRGTGADDACLARKVNVVERALRLHQPSLQRPLEMLASMGGFEIASMCGVCLGGAAHRRAVVVDGFIATVAAALAVKFHPAVKDYLFAAHRSTEPGQGPLLDLIGQRPLLDLGMRLGEGTGAALAMGVIKAAVAAFNQMATFETAAVSNVVPRRV